VGLHILDRPSGWRDHAGYSHNGCMACPRQVLRRVAEALSAEVEAKNYSLKWWHGAESVVN